MTRCLWPEWWTIPSVCQSSC